MLLQRGIIRCQVCKKLTNYHWLLLAELGSSFYGRNQPKADLHRRLSRLPEGMNSSTRSQTFAILQVKDFESQDQISAGCTASRTLSHWPPFLLLDI